MILFFRNWTYEIGYRREAIRLSSLLLLFGSLLLFSLYGPRCENELVWKVFVLLIVSQIPFYWVFSLFRLLQISENAANAIRLSSCQIERLRTFSPKETIYLYDGRRYLVIPKGRRVPEGTWTLTHIGRRPLDRNEIMKELDGGDRQ